MEFLWFILIGLVAGWLAGQLMKGGGFGIVGDIVVGVVGALLGGFLFSTLGVSTGGGLIGSLIVATIGACVLLFLLRLIKRPSRVGA
ncbi:MAG TPA: GlsB/YeaQ/YmgE family stress response membrane protein [Mesorhizobium sp.]|nr:GlsB/YeaQ/YmgE family stress response membrane protein [Mesorhizobium sp.]